MHHNCPCCTETFAEAGAHGDFTMLEWLFSLGCPWDARTCSKAAYNGHLDVLKWARSNNCPWDEGTCVVEDLEMGPIRKLSFPWHGIVTWTS
jgi:hypothetical protein